MNAECDDCGNTAELKSYDDTVEDGDGSYFQGYHHGWMLCEKCEHHFDRQTLQVYEDTYQERKFREEHADEL